MDDVFTATEQEIEDATKFTLERAKQASPRVPGYDLMIVGRFDCVLVAKPHLISSRHLLPCPASGLGLVSKLRGLI